MDRGTNWKMLTPTIMLLLLRRLARRLCYGERRFKIIIMILFGIVVLLFMTMLQYLYVHGQLSTNNSGLSILAEEREILDRVLRKATMKDNKTVILTTLNEAWASPNSVFDIFLESFKIGHNTKELLSHLVVLALDHKAYLHCLKVHTLCYSFVPVDGKNLSGDAYFMSSNYLEMMWNRIGVLRIVLELGYDFVFTDADITWFRNPFPQFYPNADFQIACDHYFGNGPLDLRNEPNGGFKYVKSNERTIKFYKFWYGSRKTYPGKHDQDVLNKIKRSLYLRWIIGLRMNFLDTVYFGGFCQPSNDLDKVCTMHANCCFGLDNKIHDMKILIQDWRNYLSSPSQYKYYQHDDDDALLSFSPWRVPQNCSTKT